MYILFLLTLIAAILMMRGRRRAGIVASLITIATFAGLFVHHMTDKLPISL